MRIVHAVTLFAVTLLACTPAHQPVPPKPPNTDLIAGDYERHAPNGDTAIRFEHGGTFRLAKNRMQFDVEPPLATGTYKVEGDKLTLINAKGICAEPTSEQEGVYSIVISKIGIRFTKVTDACARRSSMDGQTWWRVK